MQTAVPWYRVRTRWFTEKDERLERDSGHYCASRPDKAEVQLGVSTVSRVTAHQCIKLKCDTAAVPRHSRTPGNGRGGQVTIRTDFEENLKKARSQSGQN